MRLDLTWRDLANPEVENDVARHLRTLPEDEALGHVRRFITLDGKVGLRLSRRVLRRRENLELILREGLRTASPGAVQWWIESGSACIGMKRVLAIVRELLEDDPASVDRALYWLPTYVKDETDRPILKSLRADCDARLRRNEQDV